MQSYKKSRAEQNELVHFLCRDRVTSHFNAKLQKIESRTKQIHLFFLPKWSNLILIINIFISTGL